MHKQRVLFANWTNAKGQKFHITVSRYGFSHSTTASIDIFLAPPRGEEFYTLRQIIYYHYPSRYRKGKDDYSSSEKAIDESEGRKFGENYIPIKDVKKKFGSGDNCGESESGGDDH